MEGGTKGVRHEGRDVGKDRGRKGGLRKGGRDEEGREGK